jgi:hypothetical protein
MTRGFARLCVAFLATAISAGRAPVEAGEEQIPASERPTITFGADKADCLEWSDGCIVCKKDTDGESICSTAGIACQPGPPSCTRRRQE